MLKKNRSAPNSAVIPVLYYPDVRAAVEWLTTALPFTERLRNSEIAGSSCTATGPSSSPNPAYTLTPLFRHSRAPRRTPSHFVSRRSTNSLDAPRQPVLMFSLNPRIKCMANANARSSTHGDIRGHFRRRSSIPTQPTGAVNSLSNERICHDTLAWLISVSASRVMPKSHDRIRSQRQEPEQRTDADLALFRCHRDLVWKNPRSLEKPPLLFKPSYGCPSASKSNCDSHQVSILPLKFVYSPQNSCRATCQQS